VAFLNPRNVWPELPYEILRPTLETLQLCAQVVGKTRLAKTPWMNHSWHVTFYVSARGLTTGLIPYGALALELEFDLISHVLFVRATDGGQGQIALAPRSVAEFYSEFLETTAKLGLPVQIDVHPNELADPTPFPLDTAAREYDRDSAQRFWLALVQCDRVFNLFRTRFIGKCSPVHFFWGSFDLAVTRFSGRSAPLHPGDVRNLEPIPSTPEVVGAYLADAGRGYALSTLRRRVAAIARAHRIAKQPLDTRHPAIRETLRGIPARTANRRVARLPSPLPKSSGCSQPAAAISPASGTRRCSWSASPGRCAVRNCSRSMSSM
jgi:hypothetical protein